jgi:hypothetical protein
MLKLYKIGIVCKYEINDVIEANSLKQAIQVAKKCYEDGCYMAEDNVVNYLAPKFYEKHLDISEIEKEKK